MKTFSFKKGIIFFILFLAACSSHSDNSNTKKIEFGGFNFSVLNAPDDATRVEGKLSRSGSEDVEFSLVLNNGSGEVTVENLEEGAWTLTADALNGIGQKTYSGSSNVVVVANEVQDATLVLEPLPRQTKGRISITITWGLKFTEEISGSAGSNSISISWKTNINTQASVFFKESSSANFQEDTINGLTKDHQYTLSNLNDTTSYDVYVVAKRERLTLVSDTITLSTVALPPKCAFNVW